MPAPSPIDSIRAESLRYTERTVALLRRLMLEVIEAHSPETAAVLQDRNAIASPEIRQRVLQADGIWFQLFNIAEQNAAIRRRRAIEREHGTPAVSGSFSQALSHAKESGLSAEDVATRLAATRIMPTLTAHPTEAKRVTVLEIHRRIYVLLKELEETRYTAREHQRKIDSIRNEIELLWMTGELRLTKPTVGEEVSWVMHFFEESLYRGVRDLFWQLSQALREHYPGEAIDLPALLSFGCWVGGDRDGNPFVTAQTTRQALAQYRAEALAHIKSRLARVGAKLSVASHSVDVPAEFTERLEALAAFYPDPDELRRRNESEVFRQYLNILLWKLEQTERDTADGYARASELVEDLKALEAGLAGAGCGRLAEDIARPLRLEVAVFGFHTVRLDLRENSTVINATLAEIYKQLEGKDAPAADSEEWLAWITEKLAEPMEELPELSFENELSVETLKLFALLREVADKRGTDPIGAFVLSMTHTVADLLGVYLLAKYSGLFTDLENRETCSLPVVPLLETIDDLRRGPVLLKELMENPIVRRSVRAGDGWQEIMVGYSDSNKDGGFLCSNHEVAQAQSKMVRVGEEAGVPVSFFHGRGGSSSRGGAPAIRAIAAQPPGTIGGRMRLTEQGEVVSGKYANRGYAETQLEILAASVLEHSLPHETAANPGFEEAMEALSQLSHSAYRKLTEHPGLVTFYEHASPVEELALLKIGSRPARRFGAQTLDDLRAIPWVFAWTQNRMMVPGWYGIGEAILEFTRVRGDEGWALLHSMFEQHQLFRLVIDETEKALFQVQLDIAKEYTSLVPEQDSAAEIFGMITEEYARSCEAVLRVAQRDELCERFVLFRDRLERRLPIIDRVSTEQVELIRACRESEKPSMQDLVPLLLSINCVAAGLGWTG